LPLQKSNFSSDESRAISAEFNGERITDRTWPATGGNAGGHTVILELTY
jgi:hypothetical protein